MPSVAGLGHVGIFTHDLFKMRDFYSRVMGLEITDEDTEDRGIVFMSSRPEEEHHEFVLMKGRDVQEGAKVIQQISFYVDTLTELKDFHKVFKEEKVRIERTVSHGNAFENDQRNHANHLRCQFYPTLFLIMVHHLHNEISANH